MTKNAWHALSLSKQPWINDDKLWFEANPGREYRMRHTFPDELSEACLKQVPLNRNVYCIVRRVSAIVRAKIYVYTTNMILRYDCDIAEIYARIVGAEELRREKSLRDSYLMGLKS
jgi:hypothetical protein